ncbi:hypothetical protein NP233_g11806 [Leucocoprinus birnbaumii]|uniref:Uncharacterized protein n=1 Tax=Leucocoprinus birnbaumii TaxID=56174 RepID=A0AAD5VGS9_9AGAR|nr:hypothetical protein NP233_g11806 [Leucocoprinus birnbaumii]
MTSSNNYSDDVLREKPTQDDHKAPEPLPNQPSPTPSAASTCTPRLYSNSLLSSDEAIASARKVYLKTLCGGVFAIVLLIFTVFALLWGAFFRTPAKNLPGWIIVCSVDWRFLVEPTP